jgi:ATP-dependent helicase/nuclease subunit A
LKPVSAEEPADDGEGTVWRYRKVPLVPREASAPGAVVPPECKPSWLERDAPAQPPPARSLSPSTSHEEISVARAPVRGDRAERDKARMRGVLMHRLLQALPDIPQAARAEAARRHFARAAAGFSAEECEAMLEQIQQLLDDARFAQLFLPGSRAEVPIVGRLANGALAVSGQVDRLAVTDECVLIADYKTNRPAPRRLEEAEPYVTQLALYRAVLGQLFPGKPIRAALIWTDVPDLMEVSAARLDAALAGVTSP